MANPIGAWFTRVVPFGVRRILTIVTNVLLKGREITGGAYSVDAGPQIRPLFSGLKGAVVKGQTLEILEKAADAKVDSGMSHWQAALFTTVSTILISALQGLDFGLLFSDPRAFASSVLTAVVVAWGLYLKEPNRSSVDLGSNRKVAKAAQTFDSVKIEATLPDGE